MHLRKLSIISPPARIALTRLPDFYTDLPLVKILDNLLTVTTNRNHPKIYATVSSLVEFVSQADFSNQEFGAVLTKLITVFLGALS